MLLRLLPSGLRLDPYQRRRVRRSWVRLLPVALPLALVAALLLTVPARLADGPVGRAPTAGPPGDGPDDLTEPGQPRRPDGVQAGGHAVADAATALGVGADRVVVVVVPAEPAVLHLLPPGTRVDVLGPEAGDGLAGPGTVRLARSGVVLGDPLTVAASPPDHTGATPGDGPTDEGGGLLPPLGPASAGAGSGSGAVALAVTPSEAAAIAAAPAGSHSLAVLLPRPGHAD